MRQAGGKIWVERATVILLMASLAGTVCLVISVHHRTRARLAGEEQFHAARLPEPAHPAAVPSPVIASSQSEAPPTRVVEKPRPSIPPPPTPAEDPTRKAVAAIELAKAREIDAAIRADRRAEGLEKARQSAVAESERWRRREMLVKQQIASLAERARAIGRDIDALAAERDVLARERDALKAALARDQGKGSHAVLPYKGANGTWRRPIVLECTNGTVTLRPKGPTFTMLDLSSMINPRSSPVILAIARELVRVQMSDSPDGAPVVPYFVFLVRPDGIRPYYEARARLEPLGIAFGYELIQQELKVDVPDFDDVRTWDGTIPLEEPLVASPGEGTTRKDAGDGLAWPSARSVGTSSDEPSTDLGRLGGAKAPDPAREGMGDDDADSPDQFVWHSSPGGRARDRAGKAPTNRPGDEGQPGGLARGPRSDTGWGQSGGRIGADAAHLSGGGGRIGGTGTSTGPAGDSPRERWPFPGPGLGADGEKPTSPGGRSEGSTGPASRSRGSFPMVGTGTGNGRRSSLPELPDLEPAGDLASAPNSGSTSKGVDESNLGVPGLGSQDGHRRDAPASEGLNGGLDGSRGGVAMSGTGLESLPAVDPPQGLVDLHKRSGATGTEPIDVDRLKALGRLLGPTSIGRSGRSAPSGALSGASPSGQPSGAADGSPGAAGATPRAGTSGLVLGADASSSSSSSAETSGDHTFEGPRFTSRIKDAPTRTIEVPFPIVVVCGADGVTIHPGGYRITGRALEAGRADGLLVKELLLVAQRRAATDPAIRPLPRLKFLVENGGTDVFWAARKQILFSGLSWPMSLQVAGAEDAHPLGKETW